MTQSRAEKINSHLSQNVQQDIEVPNLTLSLNNITPNTPLQYPVAFEKKQLFGCRNCTRVFFSSQALGGHMNAHRKDTKAASKKCVCKKKLPRKTAAFLLSGISGSSMESVGHVDRCASPGPNPGQEKTIFEPMCDESEIRVPNMHEGRVDVASPKTLIYAAQDSDAQLDLDLRL